MDLGRGAVWATIAIVVVVMLLSGPLVQAVALTTPPPEVRPGDGSVRLNVVSVPSDDVRFERGKYGSSTYVLRVPDAVVDVKTVRGNPIVVYKIRIPELGYVRATIHVLSARHGGQRLRLALAKDSLDPARITQEAYAAELLIVVRGDDASTIRHRSNVTIRVRG